MGKLLDNANQSLDAEESKSKPIIKTVQSTRTPHECKFCHHPIPIGISAITETTIGLNKFTNTNFYKVNYYHVICHPDSTVQIRDNQI